MTIIEKAAVTEFLLFIVFGAGFGVCADAGDHRIAGAFGVGLLLAIASGVLTIIWGIWS